MIRLGGKHGLELRHRTLPPNDLTELSHDVHLVCEVCVCVLARVNGISTREVVGEYSPPSLLSFGKQPGHTMNVLDETNSTTSLAATIPATSAAPAALAFSAASASAAFPSLNERNAPVPTTLSV